MRFELFEEVQKLKAGELLSIPVTSSGLRGLITCRLTAAGFHQFEAVHGERRLAAPFELNFDHCKAAYSRIFRALGKPLEQGTHDVLYTGDHGCVDHVDVG